MKKYMSLALIIALFVFFGGRLALAQGTLPGAQNTQGVNEPNGHNNDFDNDVKKGKEEVKDLKDQELQQEVKDGEEEQAGDEEDDNIHENSDLQEEIADLQADLQEEIIDLQKEVKDGENQQAGDEKNNDINIHEDSNLQEENDQNNQEE